jgi:hypothetical protein
MFSTQKTHNVRTQYMPEIQTSAGVPVRGGYEALDPASIETSCKIDPKIAFLSLKTNYDLSEVETLLEGGAIHPLNPTTFVNAIALHPVFSEVPTDSIRTLREKRRAYTYIDEPQIVHHPHIGNHVATVATVAVAIAEYLQIDRGVTERIAKLALLHDGNKLADVLTQRAGELQLDLSKFGITPGSEVLDILVASGMARDKARIVADAGGYTGHSSLLRFLELTSEGKLQLKSGMLEEKIVHLADDMTSETTVLTTNERMVASKFIEKYEYLWKSGLGIVKTANDAVLRECTVPPVEGTTLVGKYADLQPLTSTAICAELLAIRGETPELADVKIKQAVWEVIREKRLGAST